MRGQEAQRKQCRFAFTKQCCRDFGLNWGESYEHFNPLEDDGDCARMENKCGVTPDCHDGHTYLRGLYYGDTFTPGNDAERRRASCLVVARAQIEKEQTK